MLSLSRRGFFGGLCRLFCHKLSAYLFAKLSFDTLTLGSLTFLIGALLLLNKILGASTLLLEAYAVLDVLILEKDAEEMDQLVKQEDKYGDDYNEEEALACLQEVEYLAESADAEGILSDDLGFVDGQSIDGGVVITSSAIEPELK